MDLYNFIAIEGNIGSGKTSLSSMISKQYNMPLILERFENNPFLEKFYSDKERYAFQLELSFLADRYKQLQKELLPLESSNSKIISDYIIGKSLVFSKITLQKDEYNLYQNLFHIIHNSLPKPDLLLYLYVETSKLLENIKKRNREYETNITSAYLEKIHTGYFNHFKNLKNLKIVILNTTSLNFVDNPKDYLKIMNILNQKFKNGVTKVEPY